MNNKGFSILELIVSFSICMVVVFVLFQIVVVLKEVYEKSTIKTTKTSIAEKVQAKTTPMMVNKRQNTIANRERESSLERLVEVLKNTNMNNAKEMIKVGGDKKSGASIISLLSGIQNIVGSFLEIYKQTAEEQRAAALYQQKFGSEKSSKFIINLKQQKERSNQNPAEFQKLKKDKVFGDG